MARVEGADRKSFFAVAESPNGIDNFQFLGLSRYTCLKQIIPIPMFMICVWCNMKMDGYMDYFVPNEEILMHQQAISQQPLPNAVLPEQKI